MAVFLIAGGDLRNIHIANLLSKEHTVSVIGFDDNSRFNKEIKVCLDPKELKGTVDCLILPLPVTTDQRTVNTPMSGNEILLSDILDISPRIVLGGMVSNTVQLECERRGLEISDYFDREELAILNALPTAEGAIQIIMEEIPTTIHGTKCLLTGYGRVAKVLAKLLAALGADLTVAARKYSDLAWAEVNGAKTLNISELKEHISEFPLIINTVPAKVFDRKTLTKADKHTLIVDLASKPGGVDFEDAKRLNLKVIWALSLPGKVAPYTSGEIILDTINNILKELKFS